MAAIGPATAERVNATGLRVAVTPGEYRAEALIEVLKSSSLEGTRVLIPRAKVAREVLPEKLREAGAEVVVAPAYESVPSNEGGERLKELLESREVDCVTFTASSTVENFARAFEDAAGLLSKTRVACIGPITADAARGYGLRVDVEAAEYTIPGLVDAVASLFAADEAPKEGG